MGILDRLARTAEAEVDAANAESAAAEAKKEAQAEWKEQKKDNLYRLPPGVPRWEYYRVKGPSPEEVDALGNAGWELVGVSYMGMLEFGNYGMLYTFKRPQVTRRQLFHDIPLKEQP